MVDIAIYESKDGGELAIINDDLPTIGCLTNQIYLALWGGNVLQSTDQQLELKKNAIRNDWWGNSLMEQENMFNSKAEKTINEINITSFGLSKIQSAVEEDLRYLRKYYDISVEVSMESYNRIKIIVSLKNNENSQRIKFICDKNEKIYTFIEVNHIYQDYYAWLWSDDPNKVTFYSGNGVATYR